MNSKPAQHTAAAADARLVWIPAVASLVAGAIATAASAVLAGVPGAIGGIIGTVVVVAFFGSGQLVVGRVLRTNPAIAMNTALLVYVLQILVLFVLLMLLKHATFMAPRAFGATVLACAMVWIAAAVTTMLRTRVLYVEPGSGPGSPNGK